MGKKVIQLTENELKGSIREPLETTIQYYRIDKQINALILEELGIINEVVKLSCEVIGDIKRSWRELKVQQTPNGLSYRHLKQPYQLLDQTIDIEVTIFLFKNEQDKINHEQDPDFFIWRNTHATENTIIIYLFAISGTLSNKSVETVQHEIEHYYQYICFGRGFFVNDFSDEFRRMQKDSNPNIRDIGTILYLSRHYERDEFSVGLYRLFEESNGQDIGNVLHNSDIYTDLMKLDRIKNNFNSIISNNQVCDYLKRLNKAYGIDTAKLLYSLNDAIAKIIRLIARAVLKFNKDMLKEGKYLWNSNPINNSCYLLPNPLINN